VCLLLWRVSLAVVGGFCIGDCLAALLWPVHTLRTDRGYTLSGIVKCIQ
jgi:hypothetical protein